MGCGQDGHVCNQLGIAAESMDEMTFQRGLWGAAKDNDGKRVLALLRKGRNVNGPDTYGYAPLHYAARAENLDICRTLLAADANPNAQTASGQDTPLHRASYVGCLAVAQLLIQSGALPGLKSLSSSSSFRVHPRRNLVYR